MKLPFVYVFIAALACLAVAPASHGATKIQTFTFDKDKLKPDIVYPGQIVNGALWTDNNGNNVLVLAETGIVPTTRPGFQPEARESRLSVNHYIINKDGAATLKQRMIDGDISGTGQISYAFLPNIIKITDLNFDGVAEYTVAYKRVTQHHLELSVAFFDGTQWYKIRGYSYNGKLIVSNDKPLDKTTLVFRNHVKQLWRDYGKVALK